MKRNVMNLLLIAALTASLFTGCGKSAEVAKDSEKASTETVSEVTSETASEAAGESEAAEQNEATGNHAAAETACPLEDGIYSAKFETDSTMFHVNEANKELGVLTVKDGQMTIHVSLASKGILHLFVGLAEDAAKESAVVLDPTTDTVTYDDGTTDDVFGFDIPVPVYDQEFDCALIGKKEKWYDHKVKVTGAEACAAEAAAIELEDGEYEAAVSLEGGSGKASVASPAKLVVKDGAATATIQWSSKNYDFMMIGEDRYEPLSTENGSIFEIPVTVLGAPMEVQADTTAMGNPHLIDYTLTFVVE